MLQIFGKFKIGRSSLDFTKIVCWDELLLVNLVININFDFELNPLDKYIQNCIF